MFGHLMGPPRGDMAGVTRGEWGVRARKVQATGGNWDDAGVSR